MDLKELIEQLKIQDIEHKQENEDSIKRHQKMYPEEPIPNYLRRMVSFPFILSVMCESLLRIEEKVK